MTTPISNISLLHVAAEFAPDTVTVSEFMGPPAPGEVTGIQATGPIGLGSFYAGGPWVSNPPPTSQYQTGPVPTNGTISLGNFLGLTDIFYFTDVVSAHMSNYNLRSRALAAGWNPEAALIATVTVNSNIYITATDVNTYAFDTYNVDGWRAGSSLHLINLGNIYGCGGAGGAGGYVTVAANTANSDFNLAGFTMVPATNGGNGGPSVRIAGIPTKIRNWGSIAGGGGGGGGGAGFVYRGVMPGQTLYDPGQTGGGDTAGGEGGA